MYKAKIKYFLFIVISLLLINSCTNPTGPDLMANALTSPPIITGIVRTGEDSPEQLGVIGKPNEKTSLLLSSLKRSVEPSAIPIRYSVEAPYPNPTDGSVKIRFSLPANAKINIWAIKGIATGGFLNNNPTYLNEYIPNVSKNYTRELMALQGRTAGVYALSWDCKDENQKSLPDGFYRVYISVNGNLMWRNIMIYHNLRQEQH